MLAETYTITQHKFKCPVCQGKTGFSYGHLEADSHFGPWYCQDCGQGIAGRTTEQGDVHLDPVDPAMRINPVLVLLKCGDLHFIVEHFGHPDWDDDNHQYFFEEHTCAVNWLGKVKEVIRSGETDPHGIAKVLGVVRQAWDESLDNSPVEAFEELFKVKMTKRCRCGSRTCPECN